MMKTLLWLDDLRDPKIGDWLLSYAPIFAYDEDTNVVWVKSFDEFVDYMKNNPMPHTIAFDHDLGEDVAQNKVFYGLPKKQARAEKKFEKSGMDAAKWLVEFCMDTKTKLPNWTIQSANPTGRENINSLLLSYLKHE